VFKAKGLRFNLENQFLGTSSIFIIGSEIRTKLGLLLTIE